MPSHGLWCRGTSLVAAYGSHGRVHPSYGPGHFPAVRLAMMSNNLSLIQLGLIPHSSSTSSTGWQGGSAHCARGKGTGVEGLAVAIRTHPATHSSLDRTVTWL